MPSTSRQRERLPYLSAHVKAELTLHYDGPRGELHAGWRIRDVVTGEILGMGAFPVDVPGVQKRELVDVVAWLDATVRTYLQPF